MITTTPSKTRIAVYGCDPREATLFRALGHRFGVELLLTEAPLSGATVELAAGCRCVSIGHKTRVDDGTLLALSRVGVEFVCTRSIGCNHLDVDYARHLGLRVGTVAYSPDSVADYTLMLILMAIRRAAAVLCRAGRHDYTQDAVPGRELRDLTVGVVGTGRIGTAVLTRLEGFGCRVLAHDIRADAGACTPLDELLSRSDVVTLHTPLDATTHHLLDRDRLARMRRGAFVVNTGRGALVDTDALVDALESGRLGGAALDVVEGEEGVFYADHTDGYVGSERLLRLQTLPNVLISPHTAYYTDHALADIVANSLASCVSFESRSPAWAG